jgi:hypothetical protein
MLNIPDSRNVLGILAALLSRSHKANSYGIISSKSIIYAANTITSPSVLKDTQFSCMYTIAPNPSV